MVNKDRAHLSELHVMVIELLFHDLLQYPKSENMCFLQGHLLQAKVSGAHYQE